MVAPGPLAGKELLVALPALAHEHAVALPGGEDFLAALPDHLPVGHPLWERLAFAIHAAWIGGRFDAPAWAHRCLVQSLRLAWAGKPLEEAGSVPLFPAWLQSTAALGDLAPLTGLVEARVDWLSNPVNSGVQLHSLRLANRFKAAHLIRPVLLLLAPGALDDRVVANEVIQGVLALALLAESPEELRDVGRALQVLLPDAVAAPSAHWPDDQLVKLGWAALHCVNLGALRRVVREWVARGPGDSSGEFLGWAFNLLMRHETDDEVAELLVRAAAALPGSPLIQMRRAKLARERDASDEEVEAFLASLDPAARGYRTAILWLANDLFAAGRGDLAARYFERAQAIAPLGAADQARLGQIEVRGAAKAPIQLGSDDHFRLATDSPLAGAMAPMLELLNTSWTHEGGRDAASLRQAGALALAHLAAALPSLGRLPLAEFANVANELHIVTNQYFRDLARMPVFFEFALTAAYGTLDFARCAAVCDIVHEHLLTLAEFVIGMERPLQRDPEQSKPESWFDVLRWGCDAAIALEGHERALALAQHAQRRLGVEAGGDLVGRIEEQCLLAAGRLAEAREVRRRMFHDADADVIPLRPWPEWVRELDEQPVPCFADAAMDGRFETVGPDGVLRAWPHKAMPTSLWRVGVRDARVCLSYGLEGPASAGMLRPNEWHLAMGEYPYTHADVLNRAKAAAVLRPRPARTIDEPVLVLANMDALVHRNYYHWMLLILTRAVWALEEGWLRDRRLLVPAEMSHWMESSLVDAGIDPDRMLAYGKHERLALADAWVISPVDYASPTLLRRLQHRLWRAAGLDPASPPPQDKLVYITRKDTHRRPLVEEQDLCRLAEELGFEVVAPETLNLLDQVRLFSRAKGIAGPTGAAFTNLAWSQPGTRVLSIFKEEVTMPTFVDLSIILGQQHRWLLGRTLPGFKAVHPFGAPYSVDLGLARRELDWVRCAEDLRTPARAALPSAPLQAYRAQALTNVALGRAGQLRLHPDAFWLPVSENCNLDCIGCYDAVRGFEKVYMSPDEVRRVLGTAAAGAGYKEIDLTGGEALLHPRLAEVIDVCREMHPQAEITLISNGTVPVRGKYREAYLRLDSIGLSIDGATAPTFEAIRKGARFDMFIQCVKDMVALRAATGRPRQIQLLFTACSLNLHELPGVIRLAKALGVESVFTQMMDMNLPVIRQRIGHLHLDGMDPDVRRRIIDEARAVAAEVGVRFDLPGGLVPPQRAEVGPSLAFEQKAAALGVGVSRRREGREVSQAVRMCQYPWTQAVGIRKTSHGWRAVLCCNMTEAANDELHRRYGFGDASQQSMIDLVNSPGYWQFREDVIEGRTRDACGECAAAELYPVIGQRHIVMSIDALACTRGLDFPGGASVREALWSTSAGVAELRLLEQALRRDWLAGQSMVPDWLSDVWATLQGSAAR